MDKVLRLTNTRPVPVAPPGDSLLHACPRTSRVARRAANRYNESGHRTGTRFSENQGVNLQISKRWQSFVLRYGTAVVATLLATLLRKLLDPVLEGVAPFSVYYAAVMFT